MAVLDRLDAIKILAITKDMMALLAQRAHDPGRPMTNRVSVGCQDESTQMKDGDALPLVAQLRQDGTVLMGGDPHKKPLDRLERAEEMTELTHHNIILQLMSQESRISIGSLPALVTECHRYRAEVRECVTQLWYRGLIIPDPQIPEVSYFLQMDNEQ